MPYRRGDATWCRQPSQISQSLASFGSIEILSLTIKTVLSHASTSLPKALLFLYSDIIRKWFLVLHPNTGDRQSFVVFPQDLVADANVWPRCLRRS